MLLFSGALNFAELFAKNKYLACKYNPYPLPDFKDISKELNNMHSGSEMGKWLTAKNGAAIRTFANIGQIKATCNIIKVP